MENKERFILLLQALFAFFPLAWVGMLWSASYRASLHIGRFPIPSRDDPKWIAPHDKIYHGMLDLLWDTSGIVLTVTLLSFVLLTATLPKYMKQKKFAAVLLLTLPIVLLLTTYFSDPGSRLEWFID